MLVKGMVIWYKFDAFSGSQRKKNKLIFSTIHQSGVCLPSLKKRLGPSLSCISGIHEKLKIGWFRKLKSTDFSRSLV